MGLWRGTQPTILRVGVGAGLNFFFIESIKPLLSRRGADGKTSMGPLQAAFTGGAARAIAAVVSCPITVVKTRMEFGTIESRGTVRAMRSIVRSEGVPGLFRGLGPTILSGAPFAGVYYLLYTRLQVREGGCLRKVVMAAFIIPEVHVFCFAQRSQIACNPDNASPFPAAQSRLQEGTRWQPVAINFTSGAIAAVTATILTQPFDVARTQIQLRFDPAQAGRASAAARLSSLAVLRHIGRSQGARGLLAGTVPRILKRALQTAFIWVFYEEIMGRVARHRAALEAVQDVTSPRVAK